jgi:hypothetical protein
MTQWGARRPLFAGFLAGLLQSTGGDFMLTLTLLTLFNTIAVFYVVRMVKERFGPLGASVFLIASFEFYSRFAGQTLSEQLGFAFANLALCCLFAASVIGALVWVCGE